MAITPVGTSTAYSDNTLTVSVPLPAGWAAGDTVLLHHWWSWDRAVPGGATPAGWTVDLTDTSDYSAGDTTSPNLRIYRRRMIAGDPGTVTIPTTANANNVVLALAVRGVDATTPYDVAPAAIARPAGTNAAAAPQTITSAGTLDVQTFAGQRYNADYLTTPDVWTPPGSAVGSVSRIGVFNNGLLSWEFPAAPGLAGTRIATIAPAGSAMRTARYALRASTGTSSDEAAVVQGWGTPVRVDNFTGTALDTTTQWHPPYTGAGHDGNGTRTADAIVVSDGTLKIHGYVDGRQGGLAHRFGQQYGRWEARVRANVTGTSGAQYHAVLIVWPDSDIWPDDGEYDFYEIVFGQTGLTAFMHYPHDPGAVQQIEYTLPGVDLSQWHNIAFEWQPTGLVGYCDGAPWFGPVSGGARTTPAPARRNMQAMPSGHLTAQVDMFDPTGTPMRAANLEMDWVKIYTATSSGTPTVVEQAATDAFTLTDTGVQERLAIGQAGTESATVSDDATMTVLSRTFSGTDTFTVADTAVQSLADTEAVQGTAALMIDFWLLDDDGHYVCPLPHVVSFQLSLIAGEPGTVNLEYSAAGINADQLRAAVTRKKDALVAIRIDGSDTTSLRARINSRDRDRVAEQETHKYGGHFLTRELSELAVTYQEENEKGELHFAGVSAGHMMGTALTDAQTIATDSALWWTFTNTHDSNGLPWPTQRSASIPPGTDLLKLAAMLRQWGMAETEVTSTHEVRMYVPESVGTHWELRDPPLIFRVGRDLLEAPEQVSVEDAPTDLLLAGADGIYEHVFDATARAERGRIIVEYQSQGNIDDRGVLIAYGEMELERRNNGAASNTYSLVIQPGQVKPLIDLYPSDWILADTGEGIGQPDRIMQLTVESDGDNYKSSLTVNDVFVERDVALSRRIDGLIDGTIVAGTSVPQSDWDDGLAPAQPAGVGAISLAYYDETAPKATLQASWGAVTLNEDGSPMSDLSGYEAQYRYQAGQGLPTTWTSFAITQAAETSAATDDLVQGMAVEVRVQAFDRWARNSLWSNPYLLVTATDGDAPPTPSTPDLTSYLGILTAAWDGKGSAGEEQPGDFDFVELHLSLVNGFTPDRPLLTNGRLDEAASTTYVDRLRGAGILPVTIGSYGQTWYAKLVAVDKTGNASAASAQDSALLVQANDGDIGAVSIGKLTAGVMSALMTISGIIRTAASGARVELDTTGLRCYSADGTVLFQFDIPSSLLTMRGRLIAGLGIGLGTTVDLNPTTPSLDFYPDATSRRVRQRGFTTASPDGAGPAASFARETLNAAGNTDGPTTIENRNVVWRGFRNTAGGWIGGILKLYHSDHAASGAVISAHDGSGTERALISARGTALGTASMVTNNSQVLLDDAGRIYMESAAGQYIEFNKEIGGLAGLGMRAQNAGQGVRVYYRSSDNTICFVDNASNAYMNLGGPAGAYSTKTFVVPHPVDSSRWLVHAASESPVAGVTYWGEAQIFDGQAVVELPDYFEPLTEINDRNVQVTMQLPDEPLVHEVESPEPPVPIVPYAPLPENPPVAVPEHLLLHPVAASRPRDGRFRIASSAPDGTWVTWLVNAARVEASDFEVEPLRADYDVHGDGPYRYLTPKRAS